MTDNLEALSQHRKRVSRRTIASLLIYVGFLGASVQSAVQDRGLEDMVTLAAIGAIVLAFLILPRDYVPALLQRRATTDEEEAEIDGLRRLERTGLFVRIFFVTGAIITLAVLPALVRAG